MRTQKVSKEEVKNQLLKGISPEAIAKYQGCTRQYISLVRGNYEKEGVVFPATKPGRKPQKPLLAKEKPGETVDDLLERNIKALEALQREPSRDAEIYRLKNVIASLKNEVEILRDTNQKAIEVANRLKLAQQKPDKAGV